MAFERREQRADVNSVAVPVKLGDHVGAIYVAGPASSLNSKRLEENVPGRIFGVVHRLEAAYDDG